MAGKTKKETWDAIVIALAIIAIIVAMALSR